MKSELDVLGDVGRRLESLGVPFMLTGSLALAYYAQPRMTRDIDLVIAVGSVDAQHLARAFSPDYYVSQEDVARALATEGMFNVIELESVIKADLILRKSHPYRRVEFERRQRVDLAGTLTYIVSPEDLILSKLLWAQPSRSELQLRDVRSLLTSQLDMDYLQRWADTLGVKNLLEEASQ